MPLQIIYPFLGHHQFKIMFNAGLLWREWALASNLPWGLWTCSKWPIARPYPPPFLCLDLWLAYSYKSLKVHSLTDGLLAHPSLATSIHKLDHLPFDDRLRDQMRSNPPLPSVLPVRIPFHLAVTMTHRVQLGIRGLCLINRERVDGWRSRQGLLHETYT